MTLPAIVLDTNVVLDWLVFDDAAAAPLAAALAGGQLRWLATVAMMDELRVVVGRPAPERWRDRLAPALARAHAACSVVDVPRPAHPLVCSDRSDQKFIDLALAAPCRWLLTRDRALLKLARRARVRGTEVCTPADWRPAGA